MKKFNAFTRTLNYQAAASWRVRLLAIAALLALVVLPAAAAQDPGPEVTSEPFKGRVMPDTGIARINVTAVVPCDSSETGGHTTVVFEVAKAPSYATALLTPPTVTKNFEASSCQTGGRQTFKTMLVATVNREAPAMADGAYQLRVKVTKANPATSRDHVPVTHQLTIKNDYLPLTQVIPSDLFRLVEPGKNVSYPMELVNLGNGPTRVTVELTPQGKNRLDAYNAGAEIRGLKTKAGAPNAVNRISRTIEVTAPHSDGYTNSMYYFLAKFTSKYDGTANGELEEDSTEIAFSVQVKGGLADAFSPSPGFLGAAILGVGAALARRRYQA